MCTLQHSGGGSDVVLWSLSTGEDTRQGSKTWSKVRGSHATPTLTCIKRLQHSLNPDPSIQRLRYGIVRRKTQDSKLLV
ncbi:hypothetical protein RRG08_008638 [Elysia crispata]|uniref:Uncharacterized protein n=1 Tax=Elysia crispata TaxID=231223 RepID=A0AAE1CPC0_9GAST|nr:hypothetical protein RRG08_008638 [Elysia crispata]